MAWSYRLLPSRADECGDFVERRHEIRAAVAGDDDRAGRVAHARRALRRPALQVSVEETAGKRIACPEHVQHLDAERGDIGWWQVRAKHRGPPRAALENQRFHAAIENGGDTAGDVG